jgi:hypothetical protein
MSLAIRILLLVVGAGALIGFGAFGYRAIYDAGLTAGRAEIQAKWDADRLETQKLADAAEAKNAADLAATLKLDQETIDGFKAEAAAAAAHAADYARRLHDAENRLRAGGSSLPQGRGQPGVAQPPQAPSQGRFDAAVGARLAECDANEAQLSALQAELLPQIARNLP